MNYTATKTMPTLETVDNYPVPELLIPRIAKEHNYILEKAADLLKEAKRMLFLGAHYKIRVSPSIEIDDAWHEMLMFTRFYQDFCAHIGDFMHHDPTPGVTDGGLTYRTTKEKYKELLGETPDPRYWK